MERRVRERAQEVARAEDPREVRVDGRRKERAKEKGRLRGRGIWDIVSTAADKGIRGEKPCVRG